MAIIANKRLPNNQAAVTESEPITSVLLDKSVTETNQEVEQNASCSDKNFSSSSEG